VTGFSIAEVKGRQVLDSRGYPTVEVDVKTADGSLGRASVPSGRSRGRYEAVELRDGGQRYGGFGVSKAVENVNSVIAPRILGIDVREQRTVDDVMIELDGTDDKSRLGANAILAVSLATSRAASNAVGQPLYLRLGGPKASLLPTPFLNLLGGGKLAAIDLPFQECMIVPAGAPNFSEAIAMAVEVYLELGRVVAERHGKYSLHVGDDGSYTPNIKELEEALELLLEAIERVGHEDKIDLALDCAATHFYDRERRLYRLADKMMTTEQLVELYLDILSRFNVVSIEDPFSEDDLEGFAALTGRNLQVVGDDLLATNPKRLEMALKASAANAIILKPNQVGTLSEAMDVAEKALALGWGVVVSERSGETEDDYIADLSVALNCGQIKSGAPCRAEHTAKYNRLLRIEEELGASARFAGRSYLRG